MSNESFFKGKSVVSVLLKDWMNFASGKPDVKHRVVLPMIQRGSVWAPHKVLDIWDTLLRGMPIGAMMASETIVGTSIKEIVKDGTRESSSGDISLIDGQQRTLSMLAGWPQGLVNPLRPVAIWVDLNDKAQGEYLFRLWVTTKAQPYGYARASMGGQSMNKLERSKLRLANQIWGEIDPIELWKCPYFMPWESKFALPLTELIAKRDNLKEFIEERLSSYTNALNVILKGETSQQVMKHSKDGCDFIPTYSEQVLNYFIKKRKALPENACLDKQISSLQCALNNVLTCEFPIIQVRKEYFDSQDSLAEDVNIDPPLAILFKRVGTGGEPLSNADYVYSVIKHHAPEVHETVEALLQDEKSRAIYTPAALVMSAVRMTILKLKTDDSKGQKLADSAKLDKATFSRLVRSHKEFIDEFKKIILPDGVFATCLRQVLDKLSYDEQHFKTGLPKHALCLIKIPLLETILAWHTLKKPNANTMERSRLPMVRFVLQGNLCIQDYEKASEDAVKALKSESRLIDSPDFPDQELMDVLVKGVKATAYPLPKPEDLKKIYDQNGLPLTYTPDRIQGLRGWTRFTVTDDENLSYAEVYKRWWNRKGGHFHPMLLWLQRNFVFDNFEVQPALSGMDEETPYDFDHILPSAQWAYWTGVVGNERFRDYPLTNKMVKVPDNTGHWHIGNSIGNIHILDSSKNRSIGDMSVKKKLELNRFAEDAQIFDDGKETWIDASGEEDEPRKWNPVRALKFQQAVEQRVFSLYLKFYADLFPS